MAITGQPKALEDNQKLKIGCPWGTHCNFLNSDTGLHRDIKMLHRSSKWVQDKAKSSLVTKIWATLETAGLLWPLKITRFVAMEWGND